MTAGGATMEDSNPTEGKDITMSELTEACDGGQPGQDAGACKLVTTHTLHLSP